MVRMRPTMNWIRRQLEREAYRNNGLKRPNDGKYCFFGTALYPIAKQDGVIAIIGNGEYWEWFKPLANGEYLACGEMFNTGAVCSFSVIRAFVHHVVMSPDNIAKATKDVCNATKFTTDTEFMSRM